MFDINKSINIFHLETKNPKWNANELRKASHKYLYSTDE